MWESCPLGAELRQAQKLPKDPAKIVWWKRFWGGRAMPAMVVIFLALASGVWGQGGALVYETGNSYRQMSELSKIIYIRGVLDGFMMMPTFTTPIDNVYIVPERWRKFRDYLEGKPAGQIQAIAEKYLQNNPKDWHLAMANIVLIAIVDANPQLKK